MSKSRNTTSSLSSFIRDACEISNGSRDSALYPRVLVLERTGSLNVTALERSLRELILHHGALATTMDVAGRTPESNVLVQLDVTEMSEVRDEQDVAVLRAMTEEAQHAFKSHPPPMRARLLHSGERKVLLMAVPVLTGFEISRDSLVRALDTLYEMYSSARSSLVPDLQAERLELVGDLPSRLDHTAVDRHIRYWRERLAGSPPPVELPFEYSRSSTSTFGRASVNCVFGNLGKPLEALSKQERVTTFAVLMTGFQALLSRYTNQNDLVIGAKLPGPEEHGTEGLITPQTLPMRTDLSGDPEFRELLGRVSADIGRDGEYSRIPFEHLAAQSEPLCNFLSNHFRRVVFSSAPPVSASLRGWRVLDMDAALASVDLHIESRIEGEGVRVCFTYDSELFDHTTIARMAGHYESILNACVANSDVPLSKMPLLNDAERGELVYGWNRTEAEYPRDRCTHELFEEQVRRTPRAQAVTFESETLSYYELNSRANQLAHCLRRVGAAPDTLIGICVERSAGMVAGLLGILKAGGAYVPLDPQYPSSRLDLMVEDSGLALLVTEERLRSKFSGFAGQIVCVDSEDLSRESGADCSGAAKPENLAYVIYTSGSTGKPKGVAIPHRALVNFLWSMRMQPGLTSKDIMLAVTTISFDIAGLELYLPLIVGARVALASRETASDGVKLWQLMVATESSIMQATPATWRLLLEAGWTGNANLRILCGGEPMPRDLAGELLKRSSQVWNMYGPTETTIWSTLSRIVSENDPITIGKPIANTDIYVLDTALQPVPVGVPGELYIGGDGIARGYLNRPELTAERFISHPFRKSEPEAHLYRTGDLARYRANGDVECLGRIDNQVKIRGFRIELGEIESVLKLYPGVRQNVVVAREDTPGDKRLVAYIVAGAGYSEHTDELRAFLKSKLPEYMVPAQFVRLEKLPLTPNWKVDRRALPQPDYQSSVEQHGHIPPRDGVESSLAKIWMSVLGIRSVSMDDNFFDLGGHSLLVAKLIRRIDQVFGKQLSMAAVFAAPTIERQAVMIRSGNAVPQSSIVPVQSGGSRPPLFCFGFDSGPVYLPLARHLGSEQPLFCMSLPTAQAFEFVPPYRLQDIVARLVAEMRERQPEGPYHLGGFCAGGLMAYEAACQLADQGQEIALVALFEPQVPTEIRDTESSLLALLRQKIAFHIANLRQLRRNELWPYIYTRFVRSLLLRIESLPLLLRNGEKQVKSAAQLLYLACEAYRPGRYPGQITLFQAVNRPFGSDCEAEYWKNLAGTLDIRTVPGYSNWVVSFFVEPNVSVLARELAGCLEQSAPSRRPGMPAVVAGARD